MIFIYRKQLENLHKWKTRPGRLPLIVRGARQVGKTWLLTEFGKTAFDDVVYLNFENTPSLNELFLGNLDPTRIIDMLGALHGKKIIPEKTLIIFDEVQEAPRALTALKYVAKKRPRISHLLCGLAIGCSAPCGHIVSRRQG